MSDPCVSDRAIVICNNFLSLLQKKAASAHDQLANLGPKVELVGVVLSAQVINAK